MMCSINRTTHQLGACGSPSLLAILGTSSNIDGHKIDIFSPRKASPSLGVCLHICNNLKSKRKDRSRAGQLCSCCIISSLIIMLPLLLFIVFPLLHVIFLLVVSPFSAWFPHHLASSYASSPCCFVPPPTSPPINPFCHCWVVHVVLSPALAHHLAHLVVMSPTLLSCCLPAVVLPTLLSCLLLLHLCPHLLLLLSCLLFLI